MPRLSGLDLIKRLREKPEYAAIPVLMLTAKANELPQNEMAHSLGNIEIIDKPFSPRDLCNRAEQALEKADRLRTGGADPTPVP
jgi:DNA-binding response OmpR family regulator